MTISVDSMDACFLLHRGQFHDGRWAAASAPLSTGCHGMGCRDVSQVFGCINVAVVVAASRRQPPGTASPTSPTRASA